jgi:hypothetical protein
MLQWITALEKVAASSHYTGSNRFDSFAPIRLNVAAQWLVDGVGLFVTTKRNQVHCWVLMFNIVRSVIISGISPVRFS